MIPIVILIFTLFLTMMPVNLLEVRADICTMVDIYIREPLEGERLSTYSYFGDSLYRKMVDIKWSQDPEEGAVAGEIYTVTVTAKAATGEEFDETTKARINNEEAEVTLNDDGTISASRAFKTREKDLISVVEMSIDRPQYEGTKLSTHDGSMYTNWEADISWSPEPKNGLAVAGEKYIATAIIKPKLEVGQYEVFKAGKFDENTTVTINDVPVDAVLNEDGTLTASFTFPKTKSYGLISSTEIYVEEPIEGSELSANITYDTERWKSAKLIWYPELDEDEIVATGESYTANVVLYPKDDCTFNESTTATINGKDAKVRVNNDGSLTAYYTFTVPSQKNP
jgi:hypothetical protein